MQQYQWLLFDADGTLFDYDRAESAALRQVFGLFGETFEPAWQAVFQRVNQALWHGVEKGEVTPDMVKVRRFELLLPEIGLGHSPAAFSARYLECLAGCAELIEDAAEVLQVLQGKYRVAILTNGMQAVARPRLARSAIREHVSEMIISEEVGFSKPAKEFFDAAFARLGNPSRRSALMIGDGWNSDMVGAIQYGVDACWYNPGGKPRPAGPGVTREIANLRELVGWLG